MKYFYKSVLQGKEVELTKTQFEAMYDHIMSWKWLTEVERDEELSNKFRIELEQGDVE